MYRVNPFGSCFFLISFQLQGIFLSPLIKLKIKNHINFQVLYLKYSYPSRYLRSKRMKARHPIFSFMPRTKSLKFSRTYQQAFKSSILRGKVTIQNYYQTFNLSLADLTFSSHQTLESISLNVQFVDFIQFFYTVQLKIY